MRSASGFEVDDDVAENVGICQSATVDRNDSQGATSPR